MIRNLKEAITVHRKEGHRSDEKAKAAACTSTQLSRLKDVRIVRVSRGYGGKDRHSKVCTVKGLRDRRVRLSVPTAIQLYDLQDRLGLSQPSKVIDWLLNVAKHDIDKLPPLPMFPANFNLDHSSGVPSVHQGNNSPANEAGRFNFSKSRDFDGSSELARQNSWRSNCKLYGETILTEKEDWRSRDGEGRKEISECHGPSSTHVSSSNLSQRDNHPPLLGLLNSMPLGYHWEPSNLSLSQSGNHGFTYHVDDRSNVDAVSVLPSALSLSTGMPQFLVCSPGVAQSYIPSNVTTAVEFDPRNVNLATGQIMSTNSQPPLSNSFSSYLYPMSQPMKPINLGTTIERLFHSSTNGERQPHKVRDFPS